MLTALWEQFSNTQVRWQVLLSNNTKHGQRTRTVLRIVAWCMVEKRETTRGRGRDAGKRTGYISPAWGRRLVSRVSWYPRDTIKQTIVAQRVASFKICRKNVKWYWRRCRRRDYDTIRDVILTCARKATWVRLIYRTEPTTKKCKNRKKLKVENRYAQK